MGTREALDHFMDEIMLEQQFVILAYLGVSLQYHNVPIVIATASIQYVKLPTSKNGGELHDPKPIQKISAIQKLLFRNNHSETFSTDQKLSGLESIAIQKLSRFRNYRDS